MAVSLPCSRASDGGQAGAVIRHLVAYRDGAGRWLVGDRRYELVVPRDVPARESWAVTLYDTETRCMIETPQGTPEVSSRHDPVQSADGSVRLFLSPDRPDGAPEANWIQTNPGKGFFACFRLHAPTLAFFDRSWRFANIEEVV